MCATQRTPSNGDIEAFLEDMDIAMGHAPYQQGRVIFPDWPRWESCGPADHPVAAKLIVCFWEHSPNRRYLVLLVGAAAAYAPLLDIRRSRALLELVHELVPEETAGVAASMLAAPYTPDTRPVLLALLIGMLARWKLAVACEPYVWDEVVRTIQPHVMEMLLRYLIEHELVSQRHFLVLWQTIRERALIEQDALAEHGQDLLKLQAWMNRLRDRVLAH